jgi:hypothetical protein
MRSMITLILFAGLTATLVMACGDDSSDDSTADATVCDQYCEAQAANCIDDNAITFADDCATDCATWAEGADGDTGADTTHCRLYHAGAAATDGALHCPHAGPGGGGICVDADEPDVVDDTAGDTAQATVCDQYCEVQAANCTDDNAITFDVDCETDCGTWAEGDAADTSGDTANCRLYHAGAAATDGALHCPHASPDGGGVCVD